MVNSEACGSPSHGLASPDCFQGAGHQRCRVHYARNLLALVPKAQMDMVAAVFRTIFAQPDPESMSTTWDQVRDQLAARPDLHTSGQLCGFAGSSRLIKAIWPPTSGH